MIYRMDSEPAGLQDPEAFFAEFIPGQFLFGRRACNRRAIVVDNALADMLKHRARENHIEIAISDNRRSFSHGTLYYVNWGRRTGDHISASAIEAVVWIDYPLFRRAEAQERCKIEIRSDIGNSASAGNEFGQRFF
jgi:hypothetical protein